jgi:hypothetical protein
MAGEDGKQMIENAAAETLGDAAKAAKAPLSREALVKTIIAKDEACAVKKGEVPEGCVRRVLNFKDRNYLVGAAKAYCSRDGHKGLKDQRKLDQLTKLVNFEATLDHTAELTDLIEEAQVKWESTMVRYRVWRRFKESILDEDQVKDMKKKYPGLDEEKNFQKPPIRPPEMSESDRRGPDSTFHFPAKLDAWVQDALEVMEWQVIHAEFAVELCEKFGVEEKA